MNDQLQKLKIVPVVSLPSVEAGLKLAEILLRNKLAVIEITFRTECAAGAMAAISKEYPEILLLAGTVLLEQQVDMAMRAGAKAIVSPGYSAKLSQYCRKQDIPFLPGVCTPSEVQAAMEDGLTSLKFFPAAMSGGVKMLSLFGSLYPQVNFMPTGGISENNCGDYLALNNVVCCGGTWLSPYSLMHEGNWDKIERLISSAVRTIL